MDEEITTEARICRAMGRMHYGYGLDTKTSGSEPFTDSIGQERERPVHTLEDVARYLERLADVLVGVAERDEEQSSRLRTLDHDLAAVRRVFGTEASQ